MVPSSCVVINFVGNEMSSTDETGMGVQLDADLNNPGTSGFGTAIQTSYGSGVEFSGQQSDKTFCSGHDFEMLDVGLSFDVLSPVDGSSVVQCNDPIKLRGLTTLDMVGKEFDSLKQAELFYCTYSKVVGFSVRKDDLRRNKYGATILRRWVCSKQGQRPKKWLEKRDRIREPRALTRVGCRASFRVNYHRETSKWVVKEFVTEHTHELPSACDIQVLRSNCGVQDTDMAKAKPIRSMSAKSGQVVDYMIDQSESCMNIGLVREDLQNKIDVTHQSDITDADSETVIAYLFGKADMDPGFFCKYTVDEDRKLGNLFWTDSVGRFDYSCFGDVLVFDSTYKINAYQKPLVILVGTNHHRRTSVFGFGLLKDETLDTYTWLLETFLSAMNNKKPLSIITDCDKVVCQAIKKILPESTHRFCSWHVERDARENVQDEQFIESFKDYIFSHMKPEEFDQQWLTLVAKFGLQDNDWVNKMYKKRNLWAGSFLRGKFFAGMHCSQLCQSMNSYLNCFFHSRLKMFEFVRQIDKAVSWIRYNEAKDDFESSSIPVLITHLERLEKHAVQIYTRNAFYMVRNEIQEETLLIVSGCANEVDRRVYTLTKFRNAHMRWIVAYWRKDHRIQCSCKGFETVGLPCSHSFSVMKAEHLLSIPDNLILRRWTKDAKDGKDLAVSSCQSPNDFTEMLRFAALTADCRKLCFYASKTSEGYRKAKMEIYQLTRRMEESSKINGGSISSVGFSERSSVASDPARKSRTDIHN